MPCGMGRVCRRPLTVPVKDSGVRGNGRRGHRADRCSLRRGCGSSQPPHSPPVLVPLRPCPSRLAAGGGCARTSDQTGPGRTGETKEDAASGTRPPLPLCDMSSSVGFLPGPWTVPRFGPSVGHVGSSSSARPWGRCVLLRVCVCARGAQCLVCCGCGWCCGGSSCVGLLPGGAGAFRGGGGGGLRHPQLLVPWVQLNRGPWDPQRMHTKIFWDTHGVHELILWDTQKDAQENCFGVLSGAGRNRAHDTVPANRTCYHCATGVPWRLGAVGNRPPAVGGRPPEPVLNIPEMPKQTKPPFLRKPPAGLQPVYALA